MSTVRLKIENQQIDGNSEFRNFIRVSIDQSSQTQLNLPSDYKYHSVLTLQNYADWSERMFNFAVRKDDFWIAGYAKTGTTWTHNIVWLMANGLNFTVPPKTSSDEWFEAPLIRGDSKQSDKMLQWLENRSKSFDQFDEMPSPRIFKTHLPAFLLPKDIWSTKCKIIYIARNPKDAIVSLYYMARNNFAQYTGSLENMCEMLMKDELVCAPFIDHVLSFWQLRHLEHVLFLTYEELSADPFGGVKRICEFLGYSYDDNQLKQLTEFVSFENLRKYDLENIPADISGGKKQDPDYR